MHIPDIPVFLVFVVSCFNLTVLCEKQNVHGFGNLSGKEWEMECALFCFSCVCVVLPKEERGALVHAS